jgi:hypothetical protein
MVTEASYNLLTDGFGKEPRFEAKVLATVKITSCSLGLQAILIAFFRIFNVILAFYPSYVFAFVFNS